jgi:hypothetical protein
MTATPPSIDDLDAEISRLCSRINAACYQLMLLIRQFDDRLGWAKWGYRNCAEWLAWRSGIGRSAAREQVRTAQALRDLPQISRAFAEGRLSYSKVRALTRAADAASEDALLAYALRATASQVEERCRQIRNVRPGSVNDARRAWERRTLSVWRNRHRGTLTMSVELPLETGELIAEALDLAIQSGEAADGPEFTEASWQTQQADALVALAKAYLAGGQRAHESQGEGASAPPAATATAAATADQYQVIVHVDEASLRGGLHGGAGRSDLPLETVRRLTCDGSVVEVVESVDGAPLSVGRKQRTVPSAMKRALWSRDRGCAFPGCHRTRFVDAHHVKHWAQGGDTSLDNLVLLCTHHHRLTHKGGYEIRRDHRGGFYFRRADGRVIPPCGYRAADAEPDAEELALTNPSAEGSAGASAEGFLAAIVKRQKPSAEVREAQALYRAGRVIWRKCGRRGPHDTDRYLCLDRVSPGYGLANLRTRPGAPGSRVGGFRSH